MPDRIAILFFCLLLLATTVVAYGNQVVELDEVAQEATVSIDANTPWKAGDQACIFHDDTEAACGSVISVSDHTAKMKLESISGTPQTGDEVKVSEKGGKSEPPPTENLPKKEEVTSPEEEKTAVADPESQDKPDSTKKESAAKPEPETYPIDSSTKRLEILHYHKEMIRGRPSNVIDSAGKESLDIRLGYLNIDPFNKKMTGASLDVDNPASDHWTLGLGINYISYDSTTQYFGALLTVQYYFNFANHGINLMLGVGLGSMTDSNLTAEGFGKMITIQAVLAVGGQWYLGHSPFHIGFHVGGELFKYSTGSTSSANTSSSFLVPRRVAGDTSGKAINTTDIFPYLSLEGGLSF